ncbi:hypothetical protein GUITHDRAFT_114238 [Guillardia theta CCMP2712]|uniref:Uncharacterized protein n=1 Tax=Guillardia theta (strain CCMP2712) TaxID=905079 RepID=L1IV79_GUITC|nr:hypothetical protein GUITHDRAFT_114238 [Guillardia theta CCMP2712]EKX39740.1 hypothetical protein GUITHDRAFT_114238 [Guillardia theta CCMP2712]|eukprot:XP_005826720.1 hypothetical protein GUITHDRAFT_114238 [Guillardia theta CCMP2712]
MLFDHRSRVGGDPLSPKSKPSKVPQRGSRWGIEEESNEWYKTQEQKRSVFGRTLNVIVFCQCAAVCENNKGSQPLNGSLERKDETAQTMNLLEDPIFYLILIVAAPVAILFGSAATCVVPALSLAFGFQCSW